MKNMKEDVEHTWNEELMNGNREASISIGTKLRNKYFWTDVLFAVWDKSYYQDGYPNYDQFSNSLSNKSNHLYQGFDKGKSEKNWLIIADYKVCGRYHIRGGTEGTRER